MARFIILILIIIASISALTMFKNQDVGYLTLGLGDYTFQTTLLIAGAALLAGILLLLALTKVFFLLRKFISLLNSRTLLSDGLIELAEGRFAEAEKLLLKQLKHSDNVLLTYLSVARAAQQQGEHERRDDYLRKAHEATPSAEIAIGLTKAELQLAHQQYEQALANLTHLYEISPKHAYVIKLLLKTYRRLADWKSLQLLLIDAKKQKVLSKDEFHNLELETWHGLLNDQSNNKDLTSLTSIWDKSPNELKVDGQLVEYYALLLLNLDATNQAEQVLRDHLKSNWSETTVVLYSELDVVIDNKQLEQVESWLKDHQHNAHLLLALGKLCLNKKLWGKARSHLEASLFIHAMPETYLKLAQLLEQHMDEAKLAQSYYQQGLECLAGKGHYEIASSAQTQEIEVETSQPEIDEEPSNNKTEVEESSQANDEKPDLKIIQSDAS
ncbi:MAG: heme biosynthesis protein HemY [Gammaproteobacteria bacterium]|nr:heme biosynthesis protein HemY [Gammaproteobacteria bacterium]